MSNSMDPDKLSELRVDSDTTAVVKPATTDRVFVYVCDSGTTAAAGKNDVTSKCDDLPPRRSMSTGCLPVIDTADNFRVFQQRSPHLLGRNNTVNGELDRRDCLTRCFSYSDSVGCNRQRTLLSFRDAGAESFSFLGCSVNNLYTDCVSPRVSTNSLASLQLDSNWESADLVSVSDQSSRAAAASSPAFHLYGRTSLLVDDPPFYSNNRKSPNGPVNMVTGNHIGRLLQLQPQRLSPRLQQATVAEASCDLATKLATSSAVTPSKTESMPGCKSEPATAKAAKAGAGKNTTFVDKSEKNLLTNSSTATPTEPTKSTHAPPAEPCQRRKQDVAVVSSLDASASASVSVRAVGDLERSSGSSLRLARTKCLHWLNSLDDDAD